MALKLLDPEIDLGGGDFGACRMERKERVGSGCGDQLHNAGLGEIPEGGDQMAAEAVRVHAARLAERITVHHGEALPLGLVTEPPDLGVGKENEALEMAHVPRLQKRVGQHAEKRRAQRQRDPRGHAVVAKAAKSIEQGQVCVRYRVEEPALFRVLLLSGVTHPREVRMEREHDLARRGGHAETHSRAGTPRGFGAGESTVTRAVVSRCGGRLRPRSRGEMLRGSIRDTEPVTSRPVF